MERSRRGKRHAASRGLVNVLSAAPFGYRYVTRNEGDGRAAYEIDDEQAKSFARCSIGSDAIGYRLEKQSGDSRRQTLSHPKGSPRGIAQLYGECSKTLHILDLLRLARRAWDHVDPSCVLSGAIRKHPVEQARTYDTDASEQVSIAVPVIIPKELFDVVQTQLTENRNVGVNHGEVLSTCYRAFGVRLFRLCVLW